jgi:hypothetical protein
MCKRPAFLYVLEVELAAAARCGFGRVECIADMCITKTGIETNDREIMREMILITFTP